MPTDDDIPERSELAPGATMHAPNPDTVPDTGCDVETSQSHDEASMRAWKGLPPDTLILVPDFTAPPVHCPHGMWAMLVSAVDIVGDTDPCHAGEVALFAGTWVPDQPPADGRSV